MKRKVIIAAAAAAVLVGGGTATAVGVASSGGSDDAKPLPTASDVRLGDDSDDGEGDGREGDRADRDESTGNADVSVRDAHDKILKAAPGTVTELELDTDDNRLVWEADVLGKDGKWHTVKLDARDGHVVKNRVDADKDDDRAAPRNARLSAVAAGEQAARTTNGSVTSIDLERGGAVWEVETVDKKGTEHEVDIDAASGKITKHEADHDDHADHRTNGSDDSDDDDHDGHDHDDD